MTGVERCRRDKGRQHGARALFEGLESAETVFADERTALFVEDRDPTTANEKAPFAPDAVIESCFARTQHAIAKRSDHKVMSQVPIMTL